MISTTPHSYHNQFHDSHYYDNYHNYQHKMTSSDRSPILSRLGKINPASCLKRNKSFSSSYTATSNYTSATSNYTSATSMYPSTSATSTHIHHHHNHHYNQNYTHGNVSSQMTTIYHEIYIMLCLLDDLFKYDILDIETISGSHEYLKHEFRYISNNNNNQGASLDVSVINYHIRKYLEFLRVINPMDDSSVVVADEEEADCWFVNDEIPRVIKRYIKNTIQILERYLDLVIFESQSRRLSGEFCDGGEESYSSDEGDISCYMV
ncbi:uncharacterized protein LODBEIA_P54110 [Lodderomyces beijingensis]|uniref:Uncharacterized protein n=1 Tax=Lodderomyces beijingensis TaxID=1775926 RepID=A0ABP0ZSU5_9ASCO